MAALSCLSISGGWRHASAQLGHQRQWTCCLVQTQACRQSDALQDPQDPPRSPPAAPPRPGTAGRRAARGGGALERGGCPRSCVEPLERRSHVDACRPDAVRTPSFHWKSHFLSGGARLQLLRSAINRLGRETSCSGRPSVCDLQHLAVRGERGPRLIYGRSRRCRWRRSASGAPPVSVLDALSQVARAPGRRAFPLNTTQRPHK